MCRWRALGRIVLPGGCLRVRWWLAWRGLADPAEVPRLVISGMGTERRRVGSEIVVFLDVVMADEGIGRGSE